MASGSKTVSRLYAYSSAHAQQVGSGRSYLLVAMFQFASEPIGSSAVQALRIDPALGGSAQRTCGGGRVARRRAQGRRGRHP